MFYADKPGRSEKSRDISWSTRIGEKHAAPGFTVNTRVEHAQVVLAQRKQNGSVHAPENRMNISQRIRRYLRLFHLRQYFNGKKIRRILKLYGLFVHNMIFFSNGCLPRFFQTCHRQNSWRQKIGYQCVSYSHAIAQSRSRSRVRLRLNPTVQAIRRPFTTWRFIHRRRFTCIRISFVQDPPHS